MKGVGRQISASGAVRLLTWTVVLNQLEIIEVLGHQSRFRNVILQRLNIDPQIDQMKEGRAFLMEEIVESLGIPSELIG